MKPYSKPPLKPFLYVAALLAAILIVFGLQNASPVGVSFLFWHFDGSLGLLLLVAFLLGLIAGLLLVVPGWLTKKSPRP